MITGLRSCSTGRYSEDGAVGLWAQDPGSTWQSFLRSSICCLTCRPAAPSFSCPPTPPHVSGRPALWLLTSASLLPPFWLRDAALQKGLVPCNYLEPVELRIHPQQQPQVTEHQGLTRSLPTPEPRHRQTMGGRRAERKRHWGLTSPEPTLSWYQLPRAEPRDERKNPDVLSGGISRSYWAPSSVIPPGQG